MTKLVLDTNIWIYLTGDTFQELWLRLKEESEKGIYSIVINDIILKEWERNKDKTLKQSISTIEDDYKRLKKILRLAPELSEASKQEFDDLLKNKDVRIEKVKLQINEVDRFIKSCKCIQTTDAQKIFVANLAIDKLPPFQNNKNHFNDTLILRNIIETAKSEIPFLYDVIFVSNNPKDFIDPKTNNIYASILDGFSHINIKSVTQLGEALELAPELIDEFDEWLDQKLDDWAMYQSDIMRGK